MGARKHAGVRLVDASQIELTKLQTEQIRAAMAATQPMVPVIPGQPTRRFVVFQGDFPIGTVSEIEHSDTTVEVGVRLWSVSPAAVFLISDWISDCLRRYDVAVARCYPKNWRVKRLLVRAGFRLADVRDGLEFFVVSEETYLGRRRRDG